MPGYSTGCFCCRLSKGSIIQLLSETFGFGSRFRMSVYCGKKKREDVVGEIEDNESEYFAEEYEAG